MTIDRLDRKSQRPLLGTTSVPGVAALAAFAIPFVARGPSHDLARGAGPPMDEGSG